MNVNPRRILVVTAGLVVVGAFVGAACGMIAGLVLAIGEPGARSLLSSNPFTLMALTAWFGAVAGGVGLPILGWIALRSVPLGRALGATALGTVLGAVLGQLMNPFNPNSGELPGVIAGGFLGFLAFGIAIRLSSPVSKQKHSSDQAA